MAPPLSAAVLLLMTNYDYKHPEALRHLLQDVSTLVPPSIPLYVMAEDCRLWSFTPACFEMSLKCGKDRRVDILTESIWSTLATLNTSHVLLLQPDGVICKRLTVDHFWKWSRFAFIGAPWESPADGGARVGNGGVSFRNVKCMAVWAKRARLKGCHAHPEDVYIATHAVPNCTVAPFRVARRFALEAVASPRPYFAHIFKNGALNKWALRRMKLSKAQLKLVCPNIQAHPYFRLSSHVPKDVMPLY